MIKCKSDMDRNSKTILAGGSPRIKSRLRDARGQASSNRARPPCGSVAEDRRSDGGHPGSEPLLVPGLRECSVVLTRLHERDVGAERPPGVMCSDTEPFGARGSAEETPSSGHPDASQGGGPAVANPTPEEPHVVVLLPIENYTCALCGVSAGTLMWVVNHFATRHGGVLVRYSCRLCGKASTGWRTIVCHTPHCNGGIGRRQRSGAFACEECGRGFVSNRARSTHERHVHPDLRNRKRSRQVPAASGGSSAFTQTEVEAGVLRALGEGVDPKRPRLIEETDSPMLDAADPPVAQQTLILPDGGLSVGLREVARQMVGGAEDGEEGYVRVLSAWLEGDDEVPALVESLASEILLRLRDVAVQQLPAVRTGRSLGGTAGPRWQTTGKARRLAYHACQLKYTRDQTRLAAELLDGTCTSDCPLTTEEVYGEYCGIWEGVTAFGGLGPFVPFGLASNGHMAGPISAEEVERCLNQAANATAPGPDRIGKQNILAWDPGCEKLSHMFNVWWITGVIPKCFKQCRTVLIPKTSDQSALGEIGNWRPITIGSTVLRLFSRVLTKRLVDTCPLHPRQRGFRTSPGCSENLEVLRSLFEHCKGERSQFAVVFVDFARAFDSVSHEHFLCVLRGMQVDPHVVELIRGSYQDCVTRVEIGDRQTPEINMRVGVKQGDPMSPLLFNLAMDPLIHGLERLGKGLSVSGTKVTTLAFADDLVLVSDSWQGMAHNLGILEAFCDKTGLKVKPSKSNGFLLSPTRDSFTVNNCPPWVLGGSPLRMVQAAETVGYLGVRVSPWKGIVQPTLYEDLLRWCENINRAMLKPSQKVVMLNKFAIPRLLYRADHCDVKSGTLHLLDRTIRERVKAWLHLPPSTCDGLLYARNRDGGLGICKLARLVPSIQARRIFRLSNSTDGVTRSLLDSDLAKSKFKGSWLRAGGKIEHLPQLGSEGQNTESAERGEAAGPMMPQCAAPLDWRHDEFLKWAGLNTQGVGILSFYNSKVSNSWLAKPKGFKERHYIAGLQLRANVYPTREFRLRGRGMVGASCRACPHRLESCSHILGQCPATHRSRIVRHNKLCLLLATEAEGLGWEVRREWAFRTPSGELRRLDLVLIRDSLVLVIDVTVRFEYAPDSLTRAAAEKTGYYGPHKSTIARELHAREVRVFGFPLGARGLWFPGNWEVLTAMGVGETRRKYFAALLCRRALLYSLDVLRDFNRLAGLGQGGQRGRRRWR